MPDDLDAALACHQRGLLTQAVEICEAILARSPEEVDVLNLLEGGSNKAIRPARSNSFGARLLLSLAKPRSIPI